MRVLVVSEGKHELGRRADGRQQEPGALENLIRKLGGDQAELTFDKVSSNAIHVFNGKGAGFFKRAVGWLKEAQKRNVDALILLIDQDGERNRSEQIQSAQECRLLDLPRGMGVAIRTFDAWMLADEKALTKVLGDTVSTQPPPETIRDPKRVCAGLLAKGQNQMAQSEMYARIAHRINIDRLSARCPMGFGLFAKYVRQVFVQEDCS
jgi:hypothetical protein